MYKLLPSFVSLLVFVLVFGTVPAARVFSVDTVTIQNSVHSSSQTSGQSSGGQAGQAGSDGASGADGQAGHDGQSGSSGVVQEGDARAAASITTVADDRAVSLQSVIRNTAGSATVTASSVVQSPSDIATVTLSSVTTSTQATDHNQRFYQALVGFKVWLTNYVSSIF